MARFRPWRDVLESSERPAKRRRILYYCHTRQVSGAERVLLNMLSVLDSSRYEALVACPVEGDGNLDELVRAAGVKIIPAPVVRARFTANPLKLAGYLFSVLRAVGTVRRTILSVNPDLVHANSVRAGVVATLATAGTSTRILWHVQDDLPDHVLSRGIRLLARRSRRTSFAAVSRHTARVFSGGADLAGRMTVLHNGIDLSLFPKKNDSDRDSSFRRSMGIGPDDLLFVSVGMVTPRKGLLELVEAFGLARASLPANTYLALVGAPLFNRDDLYLKAIKSRIAALGLQDRVFLPGPSREVAAVLRTADLLILNASAEPFGLVLVEAAASGTPVLATLTGGAADVLFGKELPCGFSVPPPQDCTPQVLASQLASIGIAADKREEMAERAYRIVAPRFSLEAFRKQLWKLYDESCR